MRTIRSICILLAVIFLLVSVDAFAGSRGWGRRPSSGSGSSTPSRGRTPDPGCCIIYEGGSSPSFGSRFRRRRRVSSSVVVDCIDNQTSCSGELRSNLQCSSIPACPTPTPVPTPTPTEPPLESILIELTWVDNSDNEDGFRIERMVDGSDFESIDILEPDAEYYEDMIFPNSEYCYAVFAFNVNGEAPTDVACITIPR